MLAKASKPQILCSSKPALSPQGSVHYKVHTQNYVHKTGTRCTVKCVLQSKHTKLCAQNWRLLRNPQTPEESSILSQQHGRKSVQTKSFSANENISLLYKNTFAKLNTDQCSLIAKCKALLVYSLVARRLVGLLRMLGSVSTMSRPTTDFRSTYICMLS